MTKLGILIAFIAISVAVYGQVNYGDPTAQFSKGQYRSDLRQYVKLLKKNHPQKYTFISKKDFNAHSKEKLRSLTDSTSLGQFLWACEDIAASIQCGHTFVWWPTDFGQIPDSLLFPLDTWTDGQKLFIKDARNNKEILTAGTELQSINGVEVQKILEAMYASSPSDGNIESSKRNWINHVFSSMCPMYFNYPENYSIQIEENGKIKTIELEKFESNDEKKKAKKRTDPLTLTIDSVNALGVLTIRSFDYYEDNFTIFESFIDSSFKSINSAEIKHLVIDLRGNQGGDSKCGSYLIEHIANKPYCYWPIDDNATWQKPLHQIIQPNENGFKGVPYVLVDGGCLSTSGHVGSIIKENEFGVIVGEEMGSTYICNDNSSFGTLKHTKLQYRIPRTIYSTCAASLPRNMGVLPDVEILTSINDTINNSDPVMEYVMNQLKLHE